MSANIDLYEDTGAISSGRGTTVTLLDGWNLKYSASLTTTYYPTALEVNAPLVRPLNAGEEFLSFKKYLSFKIDGTYTRIKNLRLLTTIENAAQANNVNLFYKFTNTYAVPDALYDGAMMPLSINGAIQRAVLYPFYSTSNPQSATSRQIAYGPDQTLYTNFLVVQMRVPKESTVGNSATFKLTLTCDEYLT